jgi:Zn-dependent alcohol dehydrogenase
MQKQKKLTMGKTQLIDHTSLSSHIYGDMGIITEQKLVNKHRQGKAKMEEYIRTRKLLNTELLS